MTLTLWLQCRRKSKGLGETKSQKLTEEFLQDDGAEGGPVIHIGYKVISFTVTL